MDKISVTEINQFINAAGGRQKDRVWSFRASNNAPITEIPLYKTLPDEIFTDQVPRLASIPKPIVIEVPIVNSEKEDTSDDTNTDNDHKDNNPPALSCCTWQRVTIASVVALLLSAAVGVPLYFIQQKKTPQARSTA